MKVIIKIDSAKITQAKNALIEEQSVRSDWYLAASEEQKKLQKPLEYKWVAANTIETKQGDHHDIRSILETEEIDYNQMFFNSKDLNRFLDEVRELTVRENAAILLGFPGSGNIELDEMIRAANVKKNFEKLATEDMRKAADPERWMSCLEAAQGIEDFYHDMTLSANDNTEELPY
jgi:hypothetical protein